MPSITVYPGQAETVMEAPDWSSGRPEFAFEWSRFDCDACVDGQTVAQIPT